MKQAIVVLGLGYGDEGKGTIVDFLAHHYRAHSVIRFNGGPQAAHHVVTPDNKLHCFAQFGAGSFVEELQTCLSRFMLIDPLALIAEADALNKLGFVEPLKRVLIDAQCLVVTPFHKIINRMQETARGAARHGSCGRGVGQAMLDSNYLKSRALIAGDLSNVKVLREKLKFLWHLKLDLAGQIVSEHPDNETLNKYYQQLNNTDYVERLVDAYHDFAQRSGVEIAVDATDKVLARDGTTFFEGAQGALLDYHYGFWPHVTKTRTTFHNADQLLKDYDGVIKKLGVLRAYSTRHGAGPFVSYDEELTKIIPDQHNQTNEWQREFKVGWFDMIMARYAIKIVGQIDSIAITNIDRLYGIDELKLCSAYQYRGDQTAEFRDFFYQYDPDRIEPFLVNGIEVVESPAQEHQQQLAQLLNDCQPDYITGCWCPETIPFVDDEQINHYLNFIDQSLSVPISIISTGPTRDDKRIITF